MKTMLPFAFAGLAFLTTEPADAAWRRQGVAGSCTGTTIYENPMVDGAQGYWSHNAVYKYPYSTRGISGLRLICPALDDSWLPRTAVTFLALEGYVGAYEDRIYVLACATDWDSYGGWCSATTLSPPDVGHHSLSPSLTYWGPSYAADFGYLVVGSEDQYSQLKGIYYAG